MSSTLLSLHLDSLSWSQQRGRALNPPWNRCCWTWLGHGDFIYYMFVSFITVHLLLVARASETFHYRVRHTHCPLPALFSTALRQPLYLLQTARNKRKINEGCISRYSALWLLETASIFAIEGNINHTQTDNGQWSSQKYFSSVSCRRWKQCPRVCIKWAVTRGSVPVQEHWLHERKETKQKNKRR